LQKRPQELLLNNSTSKPSFYFSSPSSGSPHTPPSPPPWESPKLKPQHSYMNPTASSKAKRSRSTSPRDNFQSCSPPHSPCFPEARSPLELEVESSLLSSSSVITFTSPISSDSSISLGALSKTSSLAHPHHTAARLTQNTQPSRIPLPKQPLSPRRSLCLDVKPIPGCSASRLRASTSTMDVRCDISPSPDKTQARCDKPESHSLHLLAADHSVTLETCRRAVTDLHQSLREAVVLYTSAELYSLPLSTSQSEGTPATSVLNSGGDKALALLEQYTELLLKSVERRLDTKT
ncbi:hypothetical protein XENOCAPTIV_026834, partial [Xenoophorus captivus]